MWTSRPGDTSIRGVTDFLTGKETLSAIWMAHLKIR
jgi:hypothetical protein